MARETPRMALGALISLIFWPKSPAGGVRRESNNLNLFRDIRPAAIRPFPLPSHQAPVPASSTLPLHSGERHDCVRKFAAKVASDVRSNAYNDARLRRSITRSNPIASG